MSFGINYLTTLSGLDELLRVVSLKASTEKNLKNLGTYRVRKERSNQINFRAFEESTAIRYLFKVWQMSMILNF